MDNTLQVFDYEGSKVRTVEIDGEAWFVGKDVATVLGYKDTRSAILDHVDEEDKRVWQIATPSNGGYSEMTVINESGVYSLIFESKLPTAKKFKHWVTSEVLPQIHKTGSYNAKNASPVNPLEGARYVCELAGIKGNQLVLAVDNVYRRYTGFSALEAGGIQLIAPTQNQLLTPTDIGRLYCMSARRVNELLAGAGYQHKIADKWEAIGDGTKYAVMQDTSKRHSDGTPIRQLKWDSSILGVVEELIRQAEEYPFAVGE